MKNNLGMTLVEVVVAMAILAITIPGFLYALQSAMYLNLHSDYESDATFYLQIEMENVIVLSDSKTAMTVFTDRGYTQDSCTSYTDSENTCIYTYLDEVNGVDYQATTTEVYLSSTPDYDLDPDMYSVLISASVNNAQVDMQSVLEFQ